MSTTETDLQDLLDSPTLNSIIDSAQDLQVDDNELKTRLADCLISTCEALDNERIQFNNNSDASVLHELLTTALSVIFDGNVEGSVHKVVIQ